MGITLPFQSALRSIREKSWYNYFRRQELILQWTLEEGNNTACIINSWDSGNIPAKPEPIRYIQKAIAEPPQLHPESPNTGCASDSHQSLPFANPTGIFSPNGHMPFLQLLGQWAGNVICLFTLQDRVSFLAIKPQQKKNQHWFSCCFFTSVTVQLYHYTQSLNSKFPSGRWDGLNHQQVHGWY